MSTEYDALAHWAPKIETREDLFAALDAGVDRWYLEQRWDAIMSRETPEALAAAGTVIMDRMPVFVVIRSRDDVPSAIQAAATYPETRWYVERRLKALRLEDDYPLPWREQ